MCGVCAPIGVLVEARDKCLVSSAVSVYLIFLDPDFFARVVATEPQNPLIFPPIIYAGVIGIHWSTRISHGCRGSKLGFLGLLNKHFTS